MKALYTTLVVALTVFSGMAQKTQKNLKLQFNHLADSVQMDFNTAYEDWQGNKYAFTRCQFYVSEMSIKHNNGEVLNLTDEYLLVDRDEVYYDLGTHDLGTIESIVFHIGVPDHVNHLDPSSYPATHPLYPQIPSMHWGWTSGYRFIAIEGLFDADGDNTPEKVFQYHAVGDKYYTQQEVVTAGEEVGNDVTLYIDFIYQNLLNTIDINNSLSVHGDGPVIDKLMNNISSGKEKVFVAGDSDILLSDGEELSQSVLDNAKEPSKAFPNPFNDFTYIQYEFKGNDRVDLYISDLSGKTIKKYSGLQSAGEQKVALNLPAGMYMYYFKRGDHILYQNKITAFE